MRKTERYLNRLKKLAIRIGEKEFLYNANEYNIQYESDCSISNIECFGWALKELPSIFKAWKFKEDNIPFLVGHEKLSPLAATATFFNLTADELFYIFVPGYNEKTYKYTSGSELANIMFDFIDQKLCSEVQKHLN